jgi:ubiquitin C-terminal hydrolase
MYTKPFTGLGNLGATCYINTTISCLGNCYDFLDFIIKKIEPDDKTLISELSVILNEQKINGHTLIPRRFIKKLIETIPELNIHTQNDINEFLAIFIDKLNRCICQEVKITKDELLKVNKYENTKYDVQRLKMDISWFEKNKKEYSTILELLYGQNISQIVCGKCKHIHHNYEIYFNIMAPILPNSKTLYDCLDNYFNEEILNLEDKEWKCDQCNTFTPSKKSIKLWKNPNVLVISLKRFTHNFKKNNQSIEIPLNLNLNKYNCSKTLNYKLKSVAMHIGNIDSGHYFSICNHSVNNKWYNIDDLNVTEEQNPDFKIYGYVFFYILDKS